MSDLHMGRFRGWLRYRQTFLLEAIDMKLHRLLHHIGLGLFLRPTRGHTTRHVRGVCREAGFGFRHNNQISFLQLRLSQNAVEGANSNIVASMSRCCHQSTFRRMLELPMAATAHPHLIPAVSLSSRMDLPDLHWRVIIIVKTEKTFKNEQRSKDAAAQKRPNTSGVGKINKYEDIYLYTSL